MFVKRGFKFRLYPTKKQISILHNHFFTSNQTWNILINITEEQFQKNLKLKENNKSPEYLSSKDLDDNIKNILKNRKLTFNTKVIQQTRRIFDNDLKLTIKSFEKSTKIPFLFSNLPF